MCNMYISVKRFREPPGIRRSWSIWWYDTSKQGIGAIFIHLTNVYLARFFQGDPCTWYVINFLLDSTIGLLIVFIGIRLCQFFAYYKQWPAINFGVYGKFLSNLLIPQNCCLSFYFFSISDAPRSWRYQTCIYIGLMALVKLSTSLFIQWKFWDSVKDLVLSPFANATIELTLFMLVIPFFVNLLIFWVTDNFLMRHDQLHHKRSFFINYVGKFKKNVSNGGAYGANTTINSNGFNNANGKCGSTRRNPLELLFDSSRQLFFGSSRMNIDDSQIQTEYNINNFNEIDYSSNNSESDALISGDERFDIELIDDDCVRLEPRNL